MITRSIVGRFLILAILIVAVGVVTQAALILAGGGKKVVKTASAAPISTSTPAETTAAPAGDPVRVVYPGPLGDTTAPRPKLADTATASPLQAPAPQTTAKLAQAMAGTAVAATAQPAAPPAAQTDVPPQAVASATPGPSPTALPAAQPAPVEPTTTSDAAPTTPAPAGVEVASLGGGVPDTDAASSAGGVNINTASVAALNHLGGGHIGESIAKHRPYRSVEELVKKRVLRRSVYDQIKNQIAAK